MKSGRRVAHVLLLDAYFIFWEYLRTFCPEIIPPVYRSERFFVAIPAGLGFRHVRILLLRRPMAPGRSRGAWPPLMFLRIGLAQAGGVAGRWFPPW